MKGAGLDVVGGVRRGLRVQSYHVFYLIEIHRCLFLSIFFYNAFCLFRSACSFFCFLLCCFYFKEPWLDGDWFFPPVTQTCSETISLAASFSASGCSHGGEKYFHFVFSFNKNDFSVLEAWRAVGSSQRYTVYLDIYIEIKIFLSFFLSCVI